MSSPLVHLIYQVVLVRDKLEIETSWAMEKVAQVLIGVLMLRTYRLIFSQQIIWNAPIYLWLIPKNHFAWWLLHFDFLNLRIMRTGKAIEIFKEMLVNQGICQLVMILHLNSWIIVSLLDIIISEIYYFIFYQSRLRINLVAVFVRCMEIYIICCLRSYSRYQA